MENKEGVRLEIRLKSNKGIGFEKPKIFVKIF